MLKFYTDAMPTHHRHCDGVAGSNPGSVIVNIRDIEAAGAFSTTAESPADVSGTFSATDERQ